MIMDWRLKATYILINKFLPFNDRIHYCLQRKIGGIRKEIIDNRWVALKDIFLMAQKHGIPKNMRVFEIGTGRYPLFPLVFFLMGVKSVLSYDIRSLMRLDAINVMIRSFKTSLSDVKAGLDLIEENTQKIEEVSKIDDFLKTISLSFNAPADARNTKMPPESFDCVFSNAVFEHVEKPDIIPTHKESYRILRGGGWLLHNIDLSDHFSHSDRKLSGINFLKYSEKKWDFLTKDSCLYQNRLRASEHIDMIQSCGFKIVETKSIVKQNEIAWLEKTKINDIFKDYEKDDLGTTGLLLLAQKPKALVKISCH